LTLKWGNANHRKRRDEHWRTGEAARLSLPPRIRDRAENRARCRLRTAQTMTFGLSSDDVWSFALRAPISIYAEMRTGQLPVLPDGSNRAVSAGRTGSNARHLKVALSRSHPPGHFPTAAASVFGRRWRKGCLGSRIEIVSPASGPFFLGLTLCNRPRRARVQGDLHGFPLPRTLGGLHRVVYPDDLPDHF
jgi:hypothetical protein